VPVRDCLDSVTSTHNAGLVFSTDGGVTWNERVVPNSAVQTHGSDPSIAIGADNTLYFFYVANENGGNEGHIRVRTTSNITNVAPTWVPAGNVAGAPRKLHRVVLPSLETRSPNMPIRKPASRLSLTLSKKSGESETITVSAIAEAVLVSLPSGQGRVFGDERGPGEG